MEEPPLLKNGRGIPTTGINPITILILTKRLKRNVNKNPPTTNLQNLSLAFNPK